MNAFTFINSDGENTFIQRRLRALNDAGITILWLGLSGINNKLFRQI